MAAASDGVRHRIARTLEIARRTAAATDRTGSSARHVACGAAAAGDAATLADADRACRRFATEAARGARRELTVGATGAVGATRTIATAATHCAAGAVE